MNNRTSPTQSTPHHSGVRARGLRKSFDGHEVLRGVDLEVAPGEVVGLIGPNGAGKTTLTSCLLGFLHVDEGSIAFDDLPNDDLTIRRRTGYVPERMNLGRRETGWDFLHYMARLAGLPRAELRPRCTATLDRLGLASAARKPLHEYSRGMLQRLALSQALIHEPDFLFLDEPTSGLDPGGVLLVRELIEEQKARGAAVLLNSHQLAEVEKVCDRFVFLRDGVIARSDTLRHVDRHVVAIRMVAGFDAAAVRRITGSEPRDGSVVVSVQSEAEIARVVRRLIESGVDVVEVRPHTTDLEEMFRGDA